MKGRSLLVLLALLACGSPLHAEHRTFAGSLLGILFGKSLALLFRGMCNEVRHVAFVPHPYYDDFPGFLWVRRYDENKEIIPPPPEASLWQYSGRLLIDNGNSFDGVNRLGGQLFLDTAQGLGLRADNHFFYERLPGGRHDHLDLWDVNVMFRLVDRERFQLHVGFGAVFLSDPCRTDGGFNATLSFDVFPVRPVVISCQFDGGNLGSAVYGHARGTVGYQWNCPEFFGGYDFMRIGSTNLQGPLLGVRVWF
jgi:hypothetical protein